MLSLLLNIKALQTQANNTIYPKGIFPSQRRHLSTGIVREDDNSFFTALIVFTLRRLEKYLTEEELVLVKDIKQQATKVFPRYRNKKGEDTYNFWRKEKRGHFPNGKIFSKVDYFCPADDVDCTALIYLANGYSDDTVKYLKNKLFHHASLPIKTSSNVLPHYRNLKLYSTWFGKNVPIEIDVCVTANLLCLLFESKASLKEYDLDCIRFICSVINNDEHKTHPFQVAPFYPKTSIILYHISRLLTIAIHPELLELKAKLKSDIYQKLTEKNHPMENIILHTSLIWLGETENIHELEMPVDTNFPWFIAGILTSAKIPFTTRLASLPFFHFRFYCKAYMQTLYLEYTLERRESIGKRTSKSILNN